MCSLNMICVFLPPYSYYFFSLGYTLFLYPIEIFPPFKTWLKVHLFLHKTFSDFFSLLLLCPTPSYSVIMFSSIDLLLYNFFVPLLLYILPCIYFCFSFPIQVLAPRVEGTQASGSKDLGANLDSTITS